MLLSSKRFNHELAALLKHFWLIGLSWCCEFRARLTVFRTLAVRREAARRASSGRKWRHNSVQCSRSVVVVMATSGRGRVTWARDQWWRETETARCEAGGCRAVRVHGYIGWSYSEHWHDHTHRRHRWFESQHNAQRFLAVLTKRWHRSTVMFLAVGACTTRTDHYMKSCMNRMYLDNLSFFGYQGRGS